MSKWCAASTTSQGFDIDLTGLDIGDSIHASKLVLPEGVRLTITDRDFTIATVAAPTVVSEEEAAAEAAAAVPAVGEAAPAEGEAAPAEGDAKKEEE
jgi:large subunit ribosomal protein L25